MPADRSRPEFVWTIPVRGDGRRADRQRWSRGWRGAGVAPDVPGWVHDVRSGALGPFDYHAQVAVAAEHAGFAGVAVPYDLQGEESWVLASVLSGETRHVGIDVEFPLGVTTPVYAAKMAATYQRISGDRLGWKLAVETDVVKARAQGDTLAPQRRYARAAEFLVAARGVWSERDFSFDGEFYQVHKGGFADPLSGHRFPRVISSGSSLEALTFAARHTDVHLFDFGSFTPGQTISLPPEVSTLRQLAADAGRHVTIGLRLPVIAREDDGEAWARADRLIGQVHGAPELRERRADGVWPGFAALDYDAGVGLVGSYAAVADRLRELAASGVGYFELDGNPHVEEAYRLGEHLLYRLDAVGAAANGS